MLCPLCLTRISREDVSSGAVSIEHIIPQHSTVEKQQKTKFTQLGVKNVRSGLTITCTTCNEKKGRELDWPLRNLITPGATRAEQYSYRTGTAILVFGYLFAFAVFGYEYILKPELAEIRAQFADPDSRSTDWLDHAVVDLDGPEQPIVCNSWGYPFIFGGIPGQTIEFISWRFRIVLPALTGVKTAVVIPDSVTKLVRSGAA